MVGKKRETGDGTPGGTNLPAPTLPGQNINLLLLFNVDNNLICKLAPDVEVLQAKGGGWRQARTLGVGNLSGEPLCS